MQGFDPPPRLKEMPEREEGDNVPSKASGYYPPPRLMGKEFEPKESSGNILARALSAVVEKSLGVFHGILEYFIGSSRPKK